MAYMGDNRSTKEVDGMATQQFNQMMFMEHEGMVPTPTWSPDSPRDKEDSKSSASTATKTTEAGEDGSHTPTPAPKRNGQGDRDGQAKRDGKEERDGQGDRTETNGSNRQLGALAPDHKWSTEIMSPLLPPDMPFDYPEFSKELDSIRYQSADSSPQPNMPTASAFLPAASAFAPDDEALKQARGSTSSAITGNGHERIKSSVTNSDAVQHSSGAITSVINGNSHERSNSSTTNAHAEQQSSNPTPSAIDGNAHERSDSSTTNALAVQQSSGPTPSVINGSVHERRTSLATNSNAVQQSSGPTASVINPVQSGRLARASNNKFASSKISDLWKNPALSPGAGQEPEIGPSGDGGLPKERRKRIKRRTRPQPPNPSSDNGMFQERKEKRAVMVAEASESVSPLRSSDADNEALTRSLPAARAHVAQVSTPRGSALQPDAAPFTVPVAPRRLLSSGNAHRTVSHGNLIQVNGTPVNGAYVNGPYVHGAHRVSRAHAHRVAVNGYPNGAYVNGVYLHGEFAHPEFVNGAYVNGAYVSNGEYMDGAYGHSPFSNGAHANGSWVHTSQLSVSSAGAAHFNSATMYPAQPYPVRMHPSMAGGPQPSYEYWSQHPYGPPPGYSGYYR